MTKKDHEINDEDEEFLRLLEDGVKKVLKDKDAKPGLRLQAVQAGAKLLAIRHKILGNDEKGFFD
jgi:hypothetical protein